MHSCWAARMANPALAMFLLAKATMVPRDRNRSAAPGAANTFIVLPQLQSKRRLQCATVSFDRTGRGILKRRGDPLIFCSGLRNYTVGIFCGKLYVHGSHKEAYSQKRRSRCDKRPDWQIRGIQRRLHPTLGRPLANRKRFTFGHHPLAFGTIPG